MRVAFADGGAISGEVSYVATESLPTPIEGIEITGATGTVPVKLLVSSGSLAMSTTTGLTFDGPSTGAEIYFSGSLANVNAALATLLYTGNSAGSDTLEVSLVEQGEVFLESNLLLLGFLSLCTGFVLTFQVCASAAVDIHC